MERDPEEDRRQLGREREERHARRVGRDSDEEQRLPREAPGDEGHRREDQQLGHLPDRHQAAATDAEHLVHRVREGIGALAVRLVLDGRQEVAREDEVELVDHADRHRDQEEREERLLADLLQALEPGGALARGLGRRRVRKRQAVARHDESEARADLERDRAPRVLRGRDLRLAHPCGGMQSQQDLPDRDARHDPSDGSPQADGAEVAVTVGKIGERERVRERKRGRIDEPVHEAQRHEELECVRDREEVDEDRPDGVACREKLLGRDRAVRELPREERPEERADGARHQAEPGLVEAEAAVVQEKRVEDRKPGAPDRVLQEHHHREAGSHIRRGRGFHLLDLLWVGSGRHSTGSASEAAGPPPYTPRLWLHAERPVRSRSATTESAASGSAATPRSQSRA